MIDTFNIAMTQTASEILGKHRQPKKPWVTTDILDLCDKCRELKKKKSEVEGAKQYREINQFIKKSMRKARETWIEHQCKDIENNLKKNNNRKAYQLVKELTSIKQGCFIR